MSPAWKTSSCATTKAMARPSRRPAMWFRSVYLKTLRDFWIAEPIALGTPGGYVTWKYGLTLLIIAIWPLLACSRLLRGEEERGSLDALLSLPRGRVRVALEKLAAVWTALLA